MPSYDDHKKPMLSGLGRQAITGNPLTPEEIEMFAMFEREDWSPHRRRAHIFALLKSNQSR